MTTFCKVVLLIVFGSCLASATHNYAPLKYSVPEPLIQAFSPRGLKVSIPHTAGIKLFAFHGNINKPLHGNLAGQLSRDIHDKEGDRWVFDDPTIELRVGDKIYYWFFVVKDNLGYRYENRVHEVKEIIPTELDNDTQMTEKSRICERVVVNLTQTLLDLRRQIASLQETNFILRDLVDKQPDTATTLTLDTPPIADDELEGVVRGVLRDKLDLRIEVSKVARNKHGRVEFQVPTLDDKVAVVKAAREKLRHSSLAILY